MKAVAKKGTPAQATRSKSGSADVWTRVGLTRQQALVVGAVLAVLLVAVAGYLIWSRVSNREVDYESALKTSPAYPQYQAAILAAQSQRYDQAEDALRKALVADSSNALIYNTLATIYVQKQEYQKALVACENGINRAPGSPDLYYTLGLVRFNLGKLDDAEQALTKALQIRERFPEAHLWLGNTYLVLARGGAEEGGGAFDPGRLTQAAASFERAIALAPDVPEYHAALGEAYFDQRELERARSEYSKASDLDPKNAKYLVAIGKIDDQLGALDLAEEAFKHATEADRLDADAHYGLGLALFKKGDRDDEAIAAFRKAIEINRYHADAHEKLGQALVRTGKQEEGDQEAKLAADARLRAGELDQLRALAAQQPNNSEVANKLGLELAKQGNYEEAFLAFQRAISLNPRNLDARYMMAGIYLTKGNVLDAMKGFEEVDKLEPGYRRTNEYLAQIYRKIGRQTEAERREQMLNAQRATGKLSDS